MSPPLTKYFQWCLHNVVHVLACIILLRQCLTLQGLQGATPVPTFCPCGFVTNSLVALLETLCALMNHHQPSISTVTDRLVDKSGDRCKYLDMRWDHISPPMGPWTSWWMGVRIYIYKYLFCGDIPVEEKRHWPFLKFWFESDTLYIRRDVRQAPQARFFSVSPRVWDCCHYGEIKSDWLLISYVYSESRIFVENW